MSQKLTLEQLVAAIRNAESLGDLKRLVGPSDEDAEASRRRIAMLDALAPACEWASMTPSAKAQEARERYRRVENEQAAFEHTYC